MSPLWNSEAFFIAPGRSKRLAVGKGEYCVSTFDKMNVKNTIFPNSH
jgi:hypothetical protein